MLTPVAAEPVKSKSAAETFCTSFEKLACNSGFRQLCVSVAGMTRANGMTRVTELRSGWSVVISKSSLLPIVVEASASEVRSSMSFPLERAKASVPRLVDGKQSSVMRYRLADCCTTVSMLTPVAAVPVMSKSLAVTF